MAKKKSIPSVCLYGNSKIGAGWLAEHDGSLLGDGEPYEGRCFTTAVFAACDALRKSGVTGSVWIYAPGGKVKAKTDISRPGYYGSLKWEPAEVYEVSIKEIENFSA